MQLKEREVLQLQVGRVSTGWGWRPGAPPGRPAEAGCSEVGHRLRQMERAVLGELVRIWERSAGRMPGRRRDLE